MSEKFPARAIPGPDDIVHADDAKTIETVITDISEDLKSPVTNFNPDRESPLHTPQHEPATYVPAIDKAGHIRPPATM